MNIDVAMLDGLAITIEGQAVSLPPSKRARALLAYLLVTQKAHRRGRLGEWFWPHASDPRAGLRWGLSKIRPLFGPEQKSRIVATREQVSVNTQGMRFDYVQASQLLAQPKVSVAQLDGLQLQLQGAFLEGLDLPDLCHYQSWLEAQRRDRAQLLTGLFARQAQHPDIPLATRITQVKQWLSLDPYCGDAATLLLSLLELTGDWRQLAMQSTLLQQRLAKAGIKWSPQARSVLPLRDPKPLASVVNPNPLPPTGAEPTTTTAPLPRSLVPSALTTKRQQQSIQFCQTQDGVNLAYAAVGKGYPIVKAANWLTHLEYDWDAPIWGPMFKQLAQNHRFIRYDERGNGLSDREVAHLDFPLFVEDLATVVACNQLQKFALLGISQGASVSIEYAVRHPDKVSHLILFGAYAAGWRVNGSPALQKEREALIALTEAGWGRDDPVYRHIFSSTFLPDATPAELSWFNDFQRLTTSSANAARFLSEFGNIDVRHRLAQVRVPTLVIHAKGDKRIPVSTAIELADAIPNAQLLLLDSNGHLLLGREPASDVFVSAIQDFIAGR